MFSQLLINKNIAFAIIASLIVAAVYLYIEALKDDIQNYQKEETALRGEIAYKTLEKERLENALEKQNREVELLRHSESIALSKLKKWQKKPPDIRYKTITKIREVKSDECKEIKDTIDAVRSIDYSLL